MRGRSLADDFARPGASVEGDRDEIVRWISRARREQREEKERVGGLFVKVLYATTSLLQRGRSPSVSVRLTVNYNHDRCVTSIMATVAG